MPGLKQNILLNVKLENEALMALGGRGGGVGQGVGILTFSEEK